jgi:hypothetical protein
MTSPGYTYKPYKPRRGLPESDQRANGLDQQDDGLARHLDEALSQIHEDERAGCEPDDYGRAAVEGDGPADEAKPNSLASSRITATPFRWRDPGEFPLRQFLYGKHRIRRYTSSTLAAGGIGKTSLGIVEALAMVTGRPLLGERIKEPLRVWYWCGEDPLEELERRTIAACLHYGIAPEEIEGRLFLDGRELTLIIAKQSREGIIVAEPVVKDVINAIQSNQIDAMTVDPFVSCHAVAENDNPAIDRVAKTWGYICEAGNCSIDLVHHLRKTGGVEATVEDGRGGIALRDAVRSARVINSMTKDQAKAAGVDNAYAYFRVENGKSNLAPRTDKSTWFKFVSVDLGNYDSENQSDQVGVVTRWEWPNPLEGVTARDLALVQTKIAEKEWRENVQSPEWAGHAVAEALRLDVANPAHKEKIKSLLRIWIANGGLKKGERHDPKKQRAYPVIEVGNAVTD